MYSFTHASPADLRGGLIDDVTHERGKFAVHLARLAEFDDRRLYPPEGYPSMFAWCVEVLGFSEDCAYKRIRAARTARRFPAIFPALAGGRLSLSAVLLLAPHLEPEGADELLAAAAGKSN